MNESVNNDLSMIQNGNALDEIDLDKRDIGELDEAFALADNIVTKRYLSNLQDYVIVDPGKEFDLSRVYEHVGAFPIKKIVYDKDENNLQKLVNLYASSVGYGNGIVMIINSDGNRTELYLGASGADEVTSARAGASAMYQNFAGNFPGSAGDGDTNPISDNRMLEGVLSRCMTDSYSGISCVSGVGSVRDKDRDADNESYVQGIEKLIDSMRGTPFSAVFIADLIGRDELDDIKAEYELLYSKLAPFLKSELSYNASVSDSVSKSLSDALTSMVTTGKSSALSVGSTKSHAHTEGTASTNTDTAGVAVGPRWAQAHYSHSTSRTKSYSDTTTVGTSRTSTDTHSTADTKGTTKTETEGIAKSEQYGKSVQISYLNKTIEQLLANIDEQLERIKESENYGVFAMAAYFLAPTPMSAKMAAGIYKGLMNGNSTHVENANINSWDDDGSVELIKRYLSKLRHPVFDFPGGNTVTPASIVSGKELAVQLGLPRSSVPGITVIETASFGRNIEKSSRTNARYIRLGRLHHMGKDEAGENVELDLDSLTMHTFITGSTGSGKSNAIYSLLEKILQRNGQSREKISFMVIEPAKGEYKNKFGNREDVTVLGTNAKVSELLRIDPFSFPDGIHVLEHIDRLIEIFNVCWPMYAAMPAVLKDAVERSYVEAGWDLTSSECRYKDPSGMPLYPCFSDVLRHINIVMNESMYSADSKGDYIGALCTRVRSLTNGLFGQIFTPDEMSQEDLFDKNVIVDLSRVGSVETKSLLMGLLVMKMQEYRMSGGIESDSRLRHLTVLEEAHNLLKKTSFEQSSETSNVLGKSVEMLSNSIAEMRTYGEGFIIADQAPGMLDMSVIRNTNTKIILRLPDQGDRELVGKAAALNDSQITELSKLKTGVAAVYQNDWLEPVLCHIDRSVTEPAKYVCTADRTDSNDADLGKAVDYLLLNAPQKLELDSDKLKELESLVYRLRLPTYVKTAMLRYMKESDPEAVRELRAAVIYGIFNSETALSLSNADKRNMQAWFEQMIDRLEPDIAALDKEKQEKIMAMIVHEHTKQNISDDSAELYDLLMQFIDRGGKR